MTRALAVARTPCVLPPHPLRSARARLSLLLVVPLILGGGLAESGPVTAEGGPVTAEGDQRVDSLPGRGDGDPITGVVHGSSSLGDVDGDGDLDLLITGQDREGQPTTSLYLGDGTGALTEASAGLTAVHHGSSELGDLDGDGAPDLVLTGANARGEPTATVYLGDGSGSFREVDSELVGVRGSSSDLADVNGDGVPDLVVTGRDRRQAPTSAVYLGDGAGHFSEAAAGLPGVHRGSSELVDVNGDERLDLLLTGLNSAGDPTTTLHLGDGEGGFAPARAGLTGVADGSSAFGDVDGDGDLDLVLAGEDGEGRATAELYLGDGAAGFVKVESPFLPVESSSTALVDIEGDGDLDLVISGTSDPIPYTLLYMGDGRGGFVSVGATHPGLRSVTAGSLSWGDLDGDGHLDLVITGRARDDEPYARAHFGDGRGWFTGLSPVGYDSCARFGDVDGDGDQDILLTGGGELGPSTKLYLGDGEGSFLPAHAGLTDTWQGSCDMGDQDGDGDPDLLVSGHTGQKNVPTTVYRNQDSVSFERIPVGRADLEYGSASFGDVQGDGDLDVVVTGEPPPRYGSLRATLYLAGESGEFTRAEAGLLGVYYSSSAFADVDLDGDLDLVVAGRAGGVASTTLYLGDGTGEFSPADVQLARIREGASTSFGDVDNDGYPDLVLAGEDENGEALSRLYLNDGEGGFAAADTELRDVMASSSDLGDVNGDGNLDLVLTGRNEGRVTSSTLYLGDGTGNFSRTPAGLVGVYRGSSTFGDFDGDGNLDLLISGFVLGRVMATKLYRGDGTGGFEEIDTR